MPVYTLDASNLENSVKARIYETFRTHYPTIDLTADDSYNDIILNPISKIFSDLYQQIDSLGKMTDLQNAANMTEAELDQLAYGNYYLTRRLGNRASTMLTLTFSNLESDRYKKDLAIPAGVIFANNSGYQFQTTEKSVVYANELYRYYNQATSRYDVQVYVEALLEGSAFNSDYQTINTCQTPFDTRLYSVTNNEAVTNGADRETNTEFAERIMTYYYTRQLNTIPGYTDLIKSIDSNVSDVKVLGYGDVEMMRDIYAFKNFELFPIETIDFYNQCIYVKGYNELPAATSTPDGPKSYIWIFGTEEIQYEVNSNNYQKQMIDGEEYTKISFVDSSISPNRYWNKIGYDPNSEKTFQHMGGKVDIYTHGEAISNKTDDLTYFSPYMIFPVKFADITKSNFQIKIGTILVDPANYEIEEVSNVDYISGIYTGDTRIYFTDDYLKNSIFDTVTNVTVICTEEDKQPVTYYYYVGNQSYELYSPLAYSVYGEEWDNIISIYAENTGQVPIYDDSASNTNGLAKNESAQIIQTGERGTTREKNQFVITASGAKFKAPNVGGTDINDTTRGSINLEIIYRVNVTLANLSLYLEKEMNRNLCADVLVMSAKPIPVEIKLAVRLNEESRTFAEEVKTRIRTSIMEYFNEHRMGFPMTDADLMGHLYGDANVYPYIAWINRPLNSNKGDPVTTSYKIIEHEDSVKGIVYRRRSDSDGLTNNNDYLPIFSIEYPVIDDDRFEVKFI